MNATSFSSVAHHYGKPLQLSSKNCQPHQIQITKRRKETFLPVLHQLNCKFIQTEIGHRPLHPKAVLVEIVISAPIDLVHSIEMASDREVLRIIWEGQIPVCFQADPNEIEGVQPENFYLLVSRLTYLPLVTDKVSSHALIPLENIGGEC